MTTTLAAVPVPEITQVFRLRSRSEDGTAVYELVGGDIYLLTVFPDGSTLHHHIVGVCMACAMPSGPSESCPRHGRRTFESKDAEPVGPPQDDVDEPVQDGADEPVRPDVEPEVATSGGVQGLRELPAEQRSHFERMMSWGPGPGAHW
jgi:hypothetical protein